MQLLFVRHAHAEDRSDWNDIGKDDFLRPLTKRGILKFTLSLEYLKQMVPEISTVYCSQLTRSIQTAEILHNFYPESDLSITQKLNPGEESKSAKDFFITNHSADTEQTIAIVGHQPDLSQLCNCVLGNPHNHYIKFKKGGMALIKLTNEAELHWLLNQRHLTAMSGKVN